MSNDELNVKPRHERRWYYERGCFGERGKHYCVPDEAKTLGERWEMKREIDPEQCIDCKRYKCKYIEYPLTINGINVKNPEPWNVCPKLCRVRPVEETNTYLGIYIGEIPRYTTVGFNEKSGILDVSAACNPLIYIPKLNKAVFGDESWWGLLENGEDIGEITGEDIKDQWYIKLLTELAKREDCVI